MLATRVGAGVLAGLIAGFVFGVLMQLAIVTTPDGVRVPLMALVAQTIGSTSLAVGWVFHLFNSAVFGAIFGLLVSARPVLSASGAIGSGAVYGVALWVIGGLVLMPLMLGMAPFAPVVMPAMHMIAALSFVGHLVYGVVLGGTYGALVPRMTAMPL